ncbi:hypothetical protein BKA70DRAFT_1216744 [Coprinopsis sp. MPI-PUGE-AT-0042]|nr:hypothetical protein BKA70DRAFT_1216744 [Coprinopsis sp. MPI-PUGE-AT-0042]
MSPSLTSESKNAPTGDHLLRQSLAPMTPGASRVSPALPALCCRITNLDFLKTKQSDKSNNNGNKKFPGWFPDGMKDGTQSGGWGRRDYKKGVEQNREPPLVGVLSFSSGGASSNTPLEVFSEQTVQDLDRAHTEKKPKRSRASKNANGRRPRPAPRAPPPTPTTSTPASKIRKAESQTKMHGPQPAYACDEEMAYHLVPLQLIDPSLLHVPGNWRTPSPSAGSSVSSLSDSSCASGSPIPEQTFYQGSELAGGMWQNRATDEPQNSYSSYPDLPNNFIPSAFVPYPSATWSVSDDEPSNNYFLMVNPQASSYEMTNDANAALNTDFGDLGSNSGQALGYFQTTDTPNISVSPPEAFAAPRGPYTPAHQPAYNVQEGPIFLASHGAAHAQARFMGDFVTMPGEHVPSNNQYETYSLYGYPGF